MLQALIAKLDQFNWPLTLSQLDLKMAELYRNANRATEKSQELLTVQRNWLK